MTGGIVIREAHFPGRAPIEAYGNGGFRFADMSHRGSILCLPSGIYAWDIAAPQHLVTADFARISAEADDIEILLIGSGIDLQPLGKDLRGLFKDARISAEPMSTGAAVRTYNVLLAEGRAVAAALMAIE